MVLFDQTMDMGVFYQSLAFYALSYKSPTSYMEEKNWTLQQYCNRLEYEMNYNYISDVYLPKVKGAFIRRSGNVPVIEI